MKKAFGFKGICLILLLLVLCTVCASAFGLVDGGAVVHQLSTKATLMTAIPLATGTIAPEVLNDLKLKYGHIKLLTVVVEDEVKDDEGIVITPAEKYVFAVRRPDRSHIKMLMPLAQDKKIDEFAEKAIKNLIVGGDEDALSDGIVYMGVVSQLKGMMQPAESFLSNA